MRPETIANNALTKNIVRLLGYYDDSENIKCLRGKIQDTINKVKEVTGTNITFNAVLDWIEARKDDPRRSLKWPSLEKLIPFAQILGVDYRELFIPKTTQGEYIKITELSAHKKALIESILEIPNEDTESLQQIGRFVHSLMNQQIKKVQAENLKKEKQYQIILGLLEASN